MYVSKDVFEMQMQFLKEHFTVVSFGELLDLWTQKTYDQSKRYCVITFDDGWLDNYIYAYPVLKKYEIPATIFLPTAFVGTNKWFWPDKIGFILRHYLLPGLKIKIAATATKPTPTYINIFCQSIGGVGGVGSVPIPILRISISSPPTGQ